MTRRYHTKHHRTRPRYPERLKRRGETSVSVRMEDLDTLRRRHGVRPQDIEAVA